MERRLAAILAADVVGYGPPYFGMVFDRDWLRTLSFHASREAPRESRWALSHTGVDQHESRNSAS